MFELASRTWMLCEHDEAVADADALLETEVFEAKTDELETCELDIDELETDELVFDAELDNDELETVELADKLETGELEMDDALVLVAHVWATGADEAETTMKETEK